MRKRLLRLVLAVGVILALSIPAGAVELHQAHQNTDDCKTLGGFTELHFVNNKIRGENAVYLWLVFDGGTMAAGLPHESNGGTNHWTVNIGDFVLDNAFTTLEDDGGGQTPIESTGPGMLVLSDFKCKKAPA